MPERPLLILPAPGEPERRKKLGGGGGRLHLPLRGRQELRLSPRFALLQQALEARRVRLQTETVGITPEEVIVLETVAPVQDFIVAVRAFEGLEWLGEVEVEDIPPDDDFFVVNEEGERQPAKTLRGRIFLIFTNQRALRSLLSLWNSWKAGIDLPRGLRKWTYVFAQLRDVRPWGVQDRLMET